MAYDLKRNRGKVSEIRQNIESKKSELAQLEAQKSELLDAVMDVQGAELDDKVKTEVKDAINSALEANENKGQELSSEMGNDAKQLEEMKQDTQESIDSARNEKGKIEKKQKMLERFGFGGKLDGAIHELDDNITELGEVNEEIISALQELSQVSQKLSGL